MGMGRVGTTVGWWGCVVVTLLSIHATPAAADGGGAAGLLNPVVIDVGTAWGAADERVPFDVRLTSSTGLVTGVQIDINFDSQTLIPTHPNEQDYPGAPFCEVNPDINKDASSFSYQGPNGIRAVIASSPNLGLIPDGSILFTCFVKVSALAPTGTYPLPCSNAQSSTALSVALPTICQPGAVEVIQHSEIDHYKCYQGSDLNSPKFTKQMVDTTDQFEDDAPTHVLGLKLVCAPVDKNGQGINDPAAHLACYGVKADAFGEEPRVLVSTQFQTTQFALQKPQLLCVPATKTLLP